MGKFWLLGDFYEKKDKTMEISIEELCAVEKWKVRRRRKWGSSGGFFEEQASEITDA